MSPFVVLKRRYFQRGFGKISAALYKRPSAISLKARRPDGYGIKRIVAKKTTHQITRVNIRPWEKLKEKGELALKDKPVKAFLIHYLSNGCFETLQGAVSLIKTGRPNPL